MFFFIFGRALSIFAVFLFLNLLFFVFLLRVFCVFFFLFPIFWCIFFLNFFPLLIFFLLLVFFVFGNIFLITLFFLFALILGQFRLRNIFHRFLFRGEGHLFGRHRRVSRLSWKGNSSNHHEMIIRVLIWRKVIFGGLNIGDLTFSHGNSWARSFDILFDIIDGQNFGMIDFDCADQIIFSLVVNHVCFGYLGLKKCPFLNDCLELSIVWRVKIGKPNIGQVTAIQRTINIKTTDNLKRWVSEL